MFRLWIQAITVVFLLLSTMNDAARIIVRRRCQHPQKGHVLCPDGYICNHKCKCQCECPDYAPSYCCPPSNPAACTPGQTVTNSSEQDNRMTKKFVQTMQRKWKIIN
uniref:Uncharacterized protein n=1 Tax=Clytia hemisphaerica TaxID=252671 RepID=A0A7M5V8J0_9CNID